MRGSKLVGLAEKFLTAFDEHQKIGAKVSELEVSAAATARKRAGGGVGFATELERAEREVGLRQHEERLSALIRQLDYLATEMTKHQPQSLEEIGAFAVLSAWAEESTTADTVPAWQIKWKTGLKEAILRIAKSRPANRKVSSISLVER